jgi:preprotein translocase subunit YajC
MPAAQAQANPLFQFLPLVLMFVVFYFLLIRPQQKRQKDQATMIKNLKRGDRVVAAGGLIGVIQGIKDDSIVLKVGAQDTKLEVLRESVQSVRPS